MTRHRPIPLHGDEVSQSVVRLRGLLGMLEQAAAARDCAASRAAVEEEEERGEVGCPLCGVSAVLHRPEVPA